MSVLNHKRSLIKRLFIFFLLFILIAFPLAASGIGEAIAGAFTFIGGLAVMAVAGWTGLGAVAGAAMMGAGLGMVGEGAGRAVEEDRIQEEQKQVFKNAYESAYSGYMQSQQLASSIQANIASTETDILQTESNISAFDQTLVRWQSQYDQQRLQLQMEGESAYTQLMQNWQGVELVNATRGQAGGSAALVAQSQLDQVERLAGADLRLDDNGGTYGTALNEFRLDMLAGRTELVGNMNIQKQALAKYQSALASYKSQLSSAQSAITHYQNAMNDAKNNAINAGVDPSYF